MGVSHFSAVSPTFSLMDVPERSTDLTLTAQEAQDVGILQVTLGAAKAVIFPTAITGKILLVKNLTGSTHGLTIKVSGQTGITIAATKAALLYCNGTDFVRLTADA